MNQTRANRSAADARRQSGQIVVEYVLLLLVAVGVATLITKLLVSRNPEDPGVVTGAWSRVINAVGKDKADDVDP